MRYGFARFSSGSRETRGPFGSFAAGAAAPAPSGGARGLDLAELRLEGADARGEAVALELDEHLLLHRRLVLRLHHLEHRLVVLVVGGGGVVLGAASAASNPRSACSSPGRRACGASCGSRAPCGTCPTSTSPCRRDLLHLLDLGAHVLELVVELLVAQVDVGHRAHVARDSLPSACIRCHSRWNMSSVSPICILSSTLRMKSSSTSGRRVTSPRAGRPASRRWARAAGLRLDRRHHLLQILVVLLLLLLLVHLHLRVLVLVVVVVERHLLEVVRRPGGAHGASTAAQRRAAASKSSVEAIAARAQLVCEAPQKLRERQERARRGAAQLEERSERGVERPTARVLEPPHARCVGWDFPIPRASAAAESSRRAPRGSARGGGRGARSSPSRAGASWRTGCGAAPAAAPSPRSGTLPSPSA